MKSVVLALSVMAAACTSAIAAEGPTPVGIPHLDHVIVIMMENHGYTQILNNPNAPFINQYAKTANLATNYYAVAHPSLTNYLEIAGGSNFGVTNDNNPDWHNAGCSPSLATGVPSNEASSARICPIAGVGTESATPAIDYSNETSGPPGVLNVDGVQSFAAASNISGITIADQLARVGGSWKSYQENLPLAGADRTDNSDGVFVNTNDLSVLSNPAVTSSSVVALYAAKHDPFVYFKSIQEGTYPGSSLSNVVGFDGDHGLYADLRTGHVPTYSFIAPNQCDDMHGKSGAGLYCNGDPNDNGTQTGLNPGLIYRGDVTVQKLITSIKASPVWSEGRTAIVVVWDENDYSVSPVDNHVVAIVDKNYGPLGKTSAKRYTHYSLLKSIEGGLGLPCLNHACDTSTSVMSDLFSGGGDR